MSANDKKDQCRRMRGGPVSLFGAIRMRVMKRLSNHIAECPRCQRRLTALNRVEIGFMLVRTQALDIGLLAKANTQAVNVLKNSLRNSPKSAVLRSAKADLSRLEKMRPGFERVLGAAACVFIVLMIKTGVSHSLLDYQEQGEAVIKNYYARNLDDQLFDEIFSEDSSSPA
ncbi:MAG: hypothetical protein ACYTEU_05095 [Planctomycetota bacterium]|jgi:hypothetical protein